MVEGGGLENRCTARYRGFESYSLRQTVLVTYSPNALGAPCLDRRNRKTLCGEMAELAEGARLLSECSLKRATEGSNPSLSASLIH